MPCCTWAEFIKLLKWKCGMSGAIWLCWFVHIFASILYAWIFAMGTTFFYSFHLVAWKYICLLSLLSLLRWYFNKRRKKNISSNIFMFSYFNFHRAFLPFIHLLTFYVCLFLSIVNFFVTISLLVNLNDRMKNNQICIFFICSLSFYFLLLDWLHA